MNGSGRYVKLTTTKRATQYGVSLWEFQVFGTGGTQPTQGAGWVNIDQAKWNAQVAAFNALPTHPFPGQRRAGVGVQRGVHLRPRIRAGRGVAYF
ncbi:hypothetical protein GCM10020218_077290 [Dactylosporangium vinaceum]